LNKIIYSNILFENFRTSNLCSFYLSQDWRSIMVFYAQKGSDVVHHTDIEALKAEGIEQSEIKEITEEEFEAAECLVRIINGKIFFGKTKEEKTKEENEKKIIVLKRQLAETDYVAAKIAEGSATKSDYADVIAKRQAWRKEIGDLSA